ncbi:MAG TPA: hypothetical protein VMS17_02340 [Gemmataceae bacterium]|nr:hypothetical protein [Gemmataceae bacterium]
MSQPSNSSAPPDWAVQQAQGALSKGMTALEVEQRLLAVGLAPDVAKDVVSRALRKSSDPPPVVDWAMEHVRAALRAGLRVPDIERQLVAKGLAPEIAEALVTNVLGERVRGEQPETPGLDRWRTLHWILSGAVACLCLLLAFLFGGAYSVGIAIVWLLTPVAFIWFADLHARWAKQYRIGAVPGAAIRWAGWFLLAIYFLYRLELVWFKP